MVLGHPKTLIVPSEEFCHEKILSLLFRGFAVNCLCFHFPSTLEAIYGISQAAVNGMKAYPELSFLLCSTLWQAAGVKQKCLLQKESLLAHLQGYSKP